MDNLSALQEEMKLYEAAAEADMTAAVTEEAAAVETAPVEEAPAEVVEAEAEASPGTEAATAEKDDAPVDAKAPKTIPVAARREERDKRHAAERELAVLTARQEERDRIAQQQQETDAQRVQREAAEAAQRQQEAEERKGRPDENEEPLLAAEWDRQAEERKAQRAAVEREQQLRNDMMQVELTADRTAFQVKQPDYQEALKWTIEKEVADYVALGFSREGALFEVNRRAGELIRMARSQRRSVAETFYSYAKLRGYAPAATETPPAATETKPAPKPPTAAEKLTTADAGRKIASLANGAGGQSPAALTDEQIDAMDSEQLRVWLRTPANRNSYNRMMGADA